MGSPRTRPGVWKVFTDKPGKAVNLSEIVDATGFTAEQCQTQVRNMIKDEFPITVLVKAQSWVYNPAPETAAPVTNPDNRTGELWEVIGQTRSGLPILRDESGVLYRATEME